jgi:two-component system, response regulator PdtaR
MPPCALIVEDEPFVALHLEDIMQALGFYVCGVAPTQERARSLALSEEPDVALMDVKLQDDSDGIEAARRLREACSAEIVFVTGNADSATLARIHQEVPGAPVLAKPIGTEQLAEALAEVKGLVRQPPPKQVKSLRSKG